MSFAAVCTKYILTAPCCMVEFGELLLLLVKLQPRLLRPKLDHKTHLMHELCLAKKKSSPKNFTGLFIAKFQFKNRPISLTFLDKEEMENGEKLVPTKLSDL